MPLVSLEVEDVFWAVLEDLDLDSEPAHVPPMYVSVSNPNPRCSLLPPTRHTTTTTTTTTELSF